MAGVVGLGSEGPEFKSHLAVELIPGNVDSACHPSEVGKMSAKNECQLAGVLCRSCDPSRIVPSSQGDRLGSTNNSAQSMVPMDGGMVIDPTVSFKKRRPVIMLGKQWQTTRCNPCLFSEFKIQLSSSADRPSKLQLTLARPL